MSVPLTTLARPVSAMAERVLGRVTFDPHHQGDASDYVFITKCFDESACSRAWAAILTTEPLSESLELTGTCPLFVDLESCAHLEGRDVVAVEPSGMVRTLYRVASQHNSILVTEHCNSRCIMCSQPPRQKQEAGLLEECGRLIDLVDPSTRQLGITGGEPTLLGETLMQLVRRLKEKLPTTAVHLLSNGRRFYYGGFARSLAGIEHPDLMVGVPLYADVDFLHDYVVQASGAFGETMIGLQNLGRFGVPVELRVVLLRPSVTRLPGLAEFIYRNLPFVSQVALMGLEPTGFAAGAWQDLWADPFDHQSEIAAFVRTLAGRGMPVCLFNIQRCLLGPDLRQCCARSISEWKCDYAEACGGCADRDLCCGFFSSAIKRGLASPHIAPIAGGAAT